MNFFHLLDNISYSPVAESAPLPMWQCSLHRRCVQQSRDRHGWWRWQDRHLQSRSGGSDSSHRFAPPPHSGNRHCALVWCHVTYVFLLDGLPLPENADSSTIHAVTYLRTAEILTVNSIGQLKMWDFRQQSSSPSQILSLYAPFTFNHTLYILICSHPSQSICLSWGRGIESLSTVLIDIRTSNTLWPQEGRTGCSVSGTWDKAARLSHSWRLILPRVRLHLRCTTDVCTL